MNGDYYFDTHWESLAALERMGFKVNPRKRLCDSLEELLAVLREVGGGAGYAAVRD